MHEEPKVVQSEKQIVRKDSSESQLMKFADSLELTKSEYQDLLKENTSKDIRLKMMYRKLHILQKENDSLRSEINQVLNERKKTKSVQTDKTYMLSESEKGIQALVHDMNASWRNISKTKRPKNILKYYMPKFIVQRIAIETDDEATVAIYTNEDFAKYIREVAREKGLSLEYGDIEFYDIEIKNDIYFKVAYKCELRVYRKDKLERKNSMLITIAGRHIENQWKIASYSEVSFKYDE
jgi:uncharacterized protein (DUF1499 family)